MENGDGRKDYLFSFVMVSSISDVSLSGSVALMLISAVKIILETVDVHEMLLLGLSWHLPFHQLYL